MINMMIIVEDLHIRLVAVRMMPRSCQAYAFREARVCVYQTEQPALWPWKRPGDIAFLFNSDLDVQQYDGAKTYL